MAGINGLKGYAKSTGDKLIAAYGNDFINVADGTGYGQSIDPNQNVEFAVFLDSLFWQNYVNTPTTFNGTSWTRKHVSKVPLSKYLQPYLNKLYLGYIKIGSVEYPSRVWQSNLPDNDTIQWGYEQRTNLVTNANNTLVSSANAGFKTFNIKIGDPFFITSGSDAGEYVVQSVIDNQHIILTEELKTTASSINYWCGGSYFDVDRDDGDFLKGLSENNNQLLIYKRDSLHRYDKTQRMKIRGAPGTTSTRSIATVRTKEWTISFYGASGEETGFYAYDGRDVFKISSSLDHHIEGIDANMFGDIVAWTEGTLYRAYVGDISNSDRGISVSKAVITIDTATRGFSIDPINDVIQVSTTLREAGQKYSYLGSADSQILKTPDGNDFDGNPVPWIIETGAIYPVGTEVMNTFPRVQVISKDAGGTRILYKLLLTPYDSDKNWNGLGEITNERTEIQIPEEWNRAAGVKFRFQGSDDQEPTAIIEKLSLFYRSDTTDL